MANQEARISDTVRRCISILFAEYRDPLLNNQTDPLDELVFVLLSEKTDEAKYLAAFHRLKTCFLHWADLISAEVSEVENLIKEAGMGKRRAELLQRMFCAIIQRFGALDLSSLALMSPQEAENELLRLPGVGRKAARCVLLYCFGFHVLPVDVHTYRLAIRLGILSRRISYEQSHAILPQFIPEKQYRSFHVNAVAHGRARCFAHNPRCNGCPLANFCSQPKAIKLLPIELRPKPIAIDLFAGAGGLSLGFKKAGLQVVQAVESDPHAAATYRHNHSEVDLLQADIRNLDPLICLQRLGLSPGDVTALIGGPPCQGFSESNRRTRTLNNPKNYLYQEFLRFLKVMQPAWFVLENVAGLCTLARGVMLQHIIEGCHDLGYEVKWARLNAADYGVPQFRRRLFIVGNRLGLPIRFPEPTHGSGREPYVTVCDAISDLPLLENGASINYLPYENNGHCLTTYQRGMRNFPDGMTHVQGNLVSLNSGKIIQRYEYISPGQNWGAIPKELLDNYRDFSRCHTGIYYRMEWDRPSKIIGNFRKNMLIHPKQHRGLSVREAARLQSFPDNYEFLGSIGFQQQQVADAVPPLLTEAVARCIKSVDHTKKTISKPQNSSVSQLGLKVAKLKPTAK